MSEKWERGCKNYVLLAGCEASWRVALVNNGVTANLGRFDDGAEAKRVAEKMELPILDRITRCVHCGERSAETFMVTDAVWRESGILAGRVHFSCLEERIGRSLVFEDFTDVPENSAIRFGYRLGTAR